MQINHGNFLYALTKIRQRLFAYLEAELARNNIHDLPPSYGDVLYVLDRRGQLTLQEIARYTMKDKSTVSSVVKRLGENGYVARERGGDDGRFVKIRLTARAKKYKPALAEISRDMNERLFAGLGEDEKSMLFGLMEKVYKNI